MSAPAAFQWDGESMVPLRRFRDQCDRQFVIGETYTLTELEERSTASHRYYFAAIREAWASLPETLASIYPSPEHLRKRALVEAGFYEEQIVDAGSNAAAIRVASAFRSREEFSLIVVRGGYVAIRSPKSQSYRAMPKGEFKRSIDGVLEVVAGLIGTDVGTLAGVREAA